MKSKFIRKLDELDALIAELKKASKEVGAMAVFVGVVRETREDEKVVKLEYEAHEALAPQKINEIINELKAKHGIIDAVVQHRTGIAKVGEEVMYALVASRHRKEAFQALEELVNRVKHKVPIWKKEITEEDSYWVENS